MSSDSCADRRRDADPVPMTGAATQSACTLGRMTLFIALAWLGAGCGSESHPPPIGGNGGASDGGTAGMSFGGSASGGSAGSASAGTHGGGSAGAAGSGGVTPLVTFDPTRVYVQGKNLAGDCGTWVVALPEAPAELSGSFPCDNNELAIRSSDGALAYRATAGDYRLWETDFVSAGFPPNPETNDVPLPEPDGCVVVAEWFEEGSAERVVRCDDGRFMRSDGEVELEGDTLVAVGKDGVYLTASDSMFTLRRSSGKTPVDLGGLSLVPSDVGHARAFGEGFLLLERPLSTTPAAALRVAPDGSVTRLADYPPIPGTTSLQSCLLEPSGVAVCLGSNQSAAAISRFDAEGTSEVIYTESAGLYLDQARLFTGP